ncbi:YkgJ family cysteine cluster protein [Roseivirga sp. E12]|uniref:YkgJ family cysteine cluster protein n=1 Tax=Roseivirga sp. E12 TaxID=2819237 RepID=UPI001ABBF653|nr:YkgJ family cysteine cluster protein [Roseivirga sp. E12]MBO3699062.1 YkgJ family cysteine cluster protein [Roseivirga sp. E12]
MIEENSPDLCTKCGVCCDGSFFELAGVQQSDINEVTRELDMLQTGERLQIKLPCTAHVNNRCTIYEVRPWVCRAYECKLLKECKRGEVSEEEAIKTIDQLKSALEELDTLLLEADVPKERRGVHKRIRILEERSLTIMAEPQYRKAYGPLLIKYRLLQKLLTERFGIPFEKRDVT